MPEQAQKGFPIPVTAAMILAGEFRKDIVVILGWDQRTSSCYTATYGTSPEAKNAAAKWGEICAAAVGGRLNEQIMHEDFRTTPAAEYKKQVDDLLLKLAEKEAIIRDLQERLDLQNKLVV